MPKQGALPPTLPPRPVTREVAAAYVCVSPNTFDEMIEQGIMPKPRILVGKRRAWDLREVDVAADALPHDGEELVAGDEGWT
jgi:predicted DNA-binding transcriptional regulator AlpA